MPSLYSQADDRRTLTPLDAWLRTAIAAADALAKLHQSGIIHQNIRPQTLRIERQGEVVSLTDANVGHRAAPSALQLPIEALPYIAPEQTGRLDSEVDRRTDLYSLGIVLYERCAGVLPFHAMDPVGWLHCHVARAPRALTDAAPETPTVVSDIVMKLLNKSPDDRYQSARGLEHDLQKCLSELSPSGRIEPFPLGTRDVWDTLRSASRMYGRTAELKTLRDAFERVKSSAEVELVLISGPSGIGKSALVRELRRESSSAHTAFLLGKFDKSKQDVPYATLGQAFQDLIRQTVASADTELATAQEQLTAALGENAQLIIELIPQVELILGKQPAVPPLPSAEARNRFHATFRSFLNVFATRERPVVLFLDDVQWADFASLELLQHLVTHADVQNLLVIVAYRDDSADPSHPLAVTLRELRDAGVSGTPIHLGPLAQTDLTDLVVDLFRCSPVEARPLAALLWTKASGNPFFAVQLLGALHQDQLIRFDTRKWLWQWDIAEIEAQQITDDLVELVLGKFRRLPGRTLDVLKLAACVGSEFTVPLLSTLCEKTPEELQSELEPALRDGLLLQRLDGYKFLHDRVLHAAYSLVPEDDRVGLHRRLGWLLYERTAVDSLEVPLFEIVNQLNLGVRHAEAADERNRIAELNLRAGRKAKATSATRSAATYLTAGLSLVTPDIWDSSYDLAFGLHYELADCESVNGRFEEADRLGELVVKHARSKVDQAAGYRLRIQLATSQLNPNRAVELALTCLHLLGIDLARNPSDDEVLNELAQVRQKLRDRPIATLIALPDMTDPEMIAATEVLSAITVSAMYIAPNLADIAIFRVVLLSILHGNTPASVHGYVLLGYFLCYRREEFHDGYHFGKLGWDLAQQVRFSAYAPEASNGFGMGIAIWSRPLQEATDILRSGVQSGRRSGKLLYSGFNLLMGVTLQLASGQPLGAAYESSVLTLDFVTGAKLSFLADNATLLQRFIYTLQGDSARFGSLSGDTFDEETFESHLREKNVPLMLFQYHVFKLMARYLAGEHAEAYAAAEAAEELLKNRLYSMVEVERCFYTALAAAAVHERADGAEREKLRDKIAAQEELFSRWAESCPENFSSRHALVAAELARIDGRDHDAAVFYDRAIRTSHAHDLLQIEAIACELAGGFYSRRAFGIIPAAYLYEARDCYARWGAAAKVRQVEQVYAALLIEPHRDSSPTPRPEAEPIDTLTAAKASAAISSEMSPEDLLATLMRILIEHAGAQRACLLLPSQTGLTVAAEITSTHDGVTVDIPKGGRTPSSAQFPLSIAHYVRRTHEKLVVDDMAVKTMFAADAYLLRSQPKSILCAPILRRGEVAGMLYLENRLVRGAFTPRRLALLEFLSAVSLENALLAADLARETAERTQAEKTLQQSEERLQRLVETAKVVPWEGDSATRRFTYVGPQVVQMLGYPQDAWLAAGFLPEHVHPDDRVTTLQHLLAPSVDEDFDFRMIAADGRAVWLHNVVSARPPDGIADLVGGLLFDVTDRKEAEATLKEKLDIIEAQQRAIRKLSTPIIEVWEGVLTMPVLGVVDEQRAEQMMNVVLDAVTRMACRYTIIDLTGVEAVDPTTAEHIMRIVRAIQLLGAKSIVVGIRPDVAQTIVSMGINLSSIITLSNLREALLLCMRDQQATRPTAGHHPKKSR